MEPDKGIRAQALFDQLHEIDLRILGLKDRTLTKTERVLRMSVFGVLMILLAFSVSILESLGIGLAIPVAAVLIASLGTVPVIRLVRRRKLERERDRLLAIHEEMDRRLGGSSAEALSKSRGPDGVIRVIEE